MTPEQASEHLASLAARVPVIPVLVVEDAAIAAPLAEALVAGGLPLLEVTLRSGSVFDIFNQQSQDVRRQGPPVEVEVIEV